ncbi:MAG: hypothetical protein MJH10_21620, partial [Epibacterium sp.]|nr:hypothetical protein [Epibacterium sp.]
RRENVSSTSLKGVSSSLSNRGLNDTKHLDASLDVAASKDESTIFSEVRCHIPAGSMAVS